MGPNCGRHTRSPVYYHKGAILPNKPKTFLDYDVVYSVGHLGAYDSLVRGLYCDDYVQWQY